MPRQLEFDFGEEFKNRNKIVDVCPSTGKPITQGEVDDYHQEILQAKAWAEHPDNPKFDLEKEVSHVNKR